MTQLTTTDIQTLIAFAIQNNKQGLIQAMNSTGNVVADTISDDDLLQAVSNVFATKGLDGIKNILSKVNLDKSKVTQAQKNVLTSKFGPDTSAGRSVGDWFNGYVTTLGDLLGGHSSVTQTPGTTTTTSILSSKTIIWISVIGVIAIVILLIVFRKSF